MNVVEFVDVWKKFKKGERFNSLRDALPYFFSFLLQKRRNEDQLEKKEFWALQGLSFVVKKGDILGIIGPNGAGKSTILKLLSKIMEPNKGRMTVRGRLSALIEITAGFHPELTGKENVYLNGTILGMSKKEIDSKFDEIVEFSGLREFIHTPVKRYSSGMYSRLGFSVAAHMDPDILLVDEVLSVGDMAFHEKCARKMQELLNSGATIVLVSHDLALVQNLCKRVILVNEGKALKEGPTEEVIPYYQDIVFKQSENELKRQIARSDRVRVLDEAKIKILEVGLVNRDPAGGDKIRTGDPVSVRIDFDARERIENPVFALEIIRADGVLCCASTTLSDGFLIDYIEGEGGIEINLSDVNLAPGIYMMKISVWDKQMLHPYVVRKKDILRFDHDRGLDGFQRGVFMTKYDWKYLQKTSLHQ